MPKKYIEAADTSRLNSYCTNLGKRMASACKPNQTEMDKFLAGKALRLEILQGK